VTNLTSGGSPDQISNLVEMGVTMPLCAMLSAKDPKIILVVLDAIRNILITAKAFDKLEAACLHLEEIGGLNKIENLQTHENEEVYRKALYIIEKFFATEVIAEMGPF
jgi:importin subunit alpha-2